MFDKIIQIDNRNIGEGQNIYIVAEIGINHNGDMELAQKMIARAAECGVDAVKFQNYRTEDFLGDHSLKYKYTIRNKEIIESQFEMFKRCELTSEDLANIAAFCRKKGIDFHATPTNHEGVKDLVDLGTHVLKNGSDYLVNLNLIKTMAETGLPVVLSTGMATLAEIDQAVQIFRDCGNRQLILLHCTSQYPAPPSEINISRIKTLATCFGCLSGFSDHSEGNTAAILAAGNGACWIEKHFTLDRNLPGPDHRFSADPQEMAMLVQSVRNAERMLGTPEIRPTNNELESRKQFRLSCTAAKDLVAGEKLTQKDILFQRPGSGIPPANSEMIIGLVIKRTVRKGTQLSQQDFI